LIVHAGGYVAGLDEVYAAPTPDPVEDWVPIPHGLLIDTVRGYFGSTGLQVVGEQHCLAREGTRYFGLFQINSENADYDLTVGLRNAHDKSFSAGLCVGSSVFVCDNLAFSSEIVLGRKHTKYIERDLPELVGRAVGALGEQRVEQDRRIELYKATELSDRDAYAGLVDLLKQRAIIGKDLIDIVHEWDTPRYSEFAGDRNVWRLFNAVTTVAKPNVFAGLKRTQVLHGVCDGLSLYQPKVIDLARDLADIEDVEVVQ
jgi:hypothetical protein